MHLPLDPTISLLEMCSTDIPALMKRSFFAALSVIKVETTQASIKKELIKLIMVKSLMEYYRAMKKNEEVLHVLIQNGVKDLC